MENQKTEAELFRCMNTLLKSVDHDYIQSCSISLVPVELLNSSNEESYVPRVVSMGPRYKGSREELLHMEEIKLRCMLALIRRVGKDENEAEVILKKCNNAIWNLNDQIRASYVDDINIEIYELVKIMLVDGCFLLELLSTKGFELDSQLSSHLNVTPSTFTPQVLQNDDVLSDLALFENQIPIFIIHELSEILFPQFFERDSKKRAILINNLALSILGYSLPQIQSPEIDPPHLLDIVHTFVNSNNNNHNHEDVVEIDMLGTQTQHVKLKRCATRLQAAGVSIQLAENKGVTGLDFEFKFEEGKLQIAALHIRKTTKAKWRNVIAWEHHKMDWKKSCSDKGNVENKISAISSSGGTCGKFTSAALIFNDLICCADDVKILKDKNIIVDHMKMSNKELEEFIRTMSFGIDHGIVGSGYVKMVDEMNKYSTVFLLIRIWKKLGHYFTYYFEWFFKFMKRDYNFVATVVSVATLLQAVYAIIAYHHPPK